jgi:general secretion pathway protein M
MNEFIANLERRYARLQPREQRMVRLGALAVGLLLLVGGVLLPLQTAISTALKRTDTRRADLEWMRVNAPEIQAAGATLMIDSTEAPVVVVDRVGRESGLGSALKGTQPSANGVRVQLGDAPFDALITWIATLDRRYGLAIESITIDRADKPGVVNANISFASPRR